MLGCGLGAEGGAVAVGDHSSEGDTVTLLRQTGRKASVPLIWYQCCAQAEQELEDVPPVLDRTLSCGCRVWISPCQAPENAACRALCAREC